MVLSRDHQVTKTGLEAEEAKRQAANQRSNEPLRATSDTNSTPVGSNDKVAETV